MTWAGSNLNADEQLLTEVRAGPPFTQPYTPHKWGLNRRKIWTGWHDTQLPKRRMFTTLVQVLPPDCQRKLPYPNGARVFRSPRDDMEFEEFVQLLFYIWLSERETKPKKTLRNTLQQIIDMTPEAARSRYALIVMAGNWNGG